MFSQSHANRLYQGQESEDNQKYQWEDELVVRHVMEVNTLTNDVYLLRGTTPKFGDFSFPIPNMHIIQMTCENGDKAECAISTKLLSSMVQEEREDDIEMKLEINDNEPFINPIAGVYIAHQDIPSELKNA